MRVFKVAEKEYRDENTENEIGIPDAGNAKSDPGTYRKRAHSQRMVSGKQLFGRIILLLAEEDPRENNRGSGNRKRDRTGSNNAA